MRPWCLCGGAAVREASLACRELGLCAGSGSMPCACLMKTWGTAMPVSGMKLLPTVFLSVRDDPPTSHPGCSHMSEGWPRGLCTCGMEVNLYVTQSHSLYATSRHADADLEEYEVLS